MENLKLYITRDENNELFLTSVKPEKNIAQKKWKLENSTENTIILDKRLFPNVKWEDSEPLELIIETKPTQDIQNEYFKTVNLMLSDNYKQRLLAEYLQLKIRIEKLENYLARINAQWHSCMPNSEKRLTVFSSCDDDLLKQQLDEMKKYLFVLKQRLIIEDIEL